MNKKKTTTFSRFLRGLKTGHRKEKHCGSSPRHTQSNARVLQAGRVGTAFVFKVDVFNPEVFYTVHWIKRVSQNTTK
jgi:hypothetical protein